MADDTRRYWDAMKQPPPSALKQIRGGRLKGMTDINPQWRLEAMTEQFGPVGGCWNYTIEKLWLEPVADEVVAFAQVSVQYDEGDGWSIPIPGIGGSKLLSMEKGGAYVNDEAYKMALTDALGVALKALGVASDIYAGLWDGARYNERPEYRVTETMLNSLKQRWGESNPDLIDLDRGEKQRAFSAWCFVIVGEHIDFNQYNAWSRDAYDKCITALSAPASDVPFDA